MNNHGVGSQLNGQSFGAFGIFDYDDPVTIRMRKYATGTHVLLKEIGVETEAHAQRGGLDQEQGRALPLPARRQRWW